MSYCCLVKIYKFFGLIYFTFTSFYYLSKKKKYNSKLFIKKEQFCIFNTVDYFGRIKFNITFLYYLFSCDYIPKFKVSLFFFFLEH